MSKKISVRNKFLELLSANEPVAIVNQARDHQNQIPFIQLPVLDQACETFVENKDSSCLRALIDNGFQIFICPSDYGTEEIGLDPPITRLLGDVVTYEPDHDSMVFLDELFTLHFDKYVEEHADPSCDLSQHWLKVLNGYREEVSEYIRSPAGFSEFLRNIDSVSSKTSAKLQI
jgi:hypothetical protein